MRTNEQILNIKKTISDPVSIDNFITDTDINYLVELFEKHSDALNKPKIYKNTGPVTLDLVPYIEDPVIHKIIENLKKTIGPFEITAAFFFSTDYPHIIHNDDTFELPPTVYEGITLPLKTYGGGDIPKLCFFNQFYFHGPAKFFNGDIDIPTYYNKQIYDYSEVDNLSIEPINEKLRISYFTHLKSKWLDQLSVHSMLDWKPGNALVFDSVRLHCASDFRQLGIKSKLGISIFTRRK